MLGDGLEYFDINEFVAKYEQTESVGEFEDES